jgi:hypothetical protein
MSVDAQGGVKGFREWARWVLESRAPVRLPDFSWYWGAIVIVTGDFVACC